MMYRYLFVNFHIMISRKFHQAIKIHVALKKLLQCNSRLWPLMWSSSFYSDYSADLYLNQNDWVVVSRFQVSIIAKFRQQFKLGFISGRYWSPMRVVIRRALTVVSSRTHTVVVVLFDCRKVLGRKFSDPMLYSWLQRGIVCVTCLVCAST